MKLRKSELLTPIVYIQIFNSVSHRRFRFFATTIFKRFLKWLFEGKKSMLDFLFDIRTDKDKWASMGEYGGGRGIAGPGARGGKHAGLVCVCVCVCVVCVVCVVCLIVCSVLFR